MVVMVRWIGLVILLLCVSKATLLEHNASAYSRVPMSMPPLFALEQHDKCLSQGGLYCLLKLDLFDNKHNPLMDMIHEYSNKHFTHYNYTNIDRGVCVDTTCRNFIQGNNLRKAEDLAAILEACLNDSIWHEYGVQAKLAFVSNCDSADDIDEINVVDWAVATACGLMVVATVVGSCYDYYVHDDSGNTVGNKYLLSFSIARNWEALIKPNVADRGLSLQGFNGVRVLFSLLVILDHSILLYGGGFHSNPRDFENAYESTSYKILFNGLTIVQSYFFISGFLLAYNIHIQSEKRLITWSTVPLIIAMRLSRLIPAYAFMLGISATWLRHLGSGPLWKYYITNSVVADCRKYWWYHLLFVHTYEPQDKFCGGHTWHLPTEMQLFILGLLVCVSTMRGGRGRALCLLFLVGSIAPAINVWVWDLDGIAVLNPEFLRSLSNDSYRYLHILPHNNLPAFIVGIALAKVLYDRSSQKETQHSSIYKILVPLMWLTIPATFFLFSSTYVMYEQERASLWLRMLLPCLQRVAMAVISAVFTAGLVLKPRYTSALRAVFEWGPWAVPSRLSYCVFLLHMHLIHMLQGARLQLTGITFLHTFVWFLGVMFLSYVAAVPLYLMVEAPVTNLCKHIIAKLDSRVKDVKHE